MLQVYRSQDTGAAFTIVVTERALKSAEYCFIATDMVLAFKGMFIWSVMGYTNYYSSLIGTL